MTPTYSVEAPTGAKIEEGFCMDISFLQLPSHIFSIIQKKPNLFISDQF